MSNWGFVTLAYGLTWATLAGYALYVHSRARRARAALREAIESLEADAARAPVPHPVEVAR